MPGESVTERQRRGAALSLPLRQHSALPEAGIFFGVRGGCRSDAGTPDTHKERKEGRKEDREKERRRNKGTGQSASNVLQMAGVEGAAAAIATPTTTTARRATEKRPIARPGHVTCCVADCSFPLLRAAPACTRCAPACVCFCLPPLPLPVSALLCSPSSVRSPLPAFSSPTSFRLSVLPAPVPAPLLCPNPNPNPIRLLSKLSLTVTHPHSLSLSLTHTHPLTLLFLSSTLPLLLYALPLRFARRPRCSPSVHSCPLTHVGRAPFVDVSAWGAPILTSHTTIPPRRHASTSHHPWGQRATFLPACDFFLIFFPLSLPPLPSQPAPDAPRSSSDPPADTTSLSSATASAEENLLRPPARPRRPLPPPLPPSHTHAPPRSSYR